MRSIKQTEGALHFIPALNRHYSKMRSFYLQIINDDSMFDIAE